MHSDQRFYLNLNSLISSGLLREAVQIAKSISTNATLLKAPPIEDGSSDEDGAAKEKVKAGIEAFDTLLRKQLVPIMKVSVKLDLLFLFVSGFLNMERTCSGTVLRVLK